MSKNSGLTQEAVFLQNYTFTDIIARKTENVKNRMIKSLLKHLKLFLIIFELN